MIKLLDGELLEFETDESYSIGCETCNYGSTYINYCEIIFTKFILKVEVTQMYEYGLTTDFWVKLMCSNAIKFINMKEIEVIEFIKKEINKINDEASIEFNIKEVI